MHFVRAVTSTAYVIIGIDVPGGAKLETMSLPIPTSAYIFSFWVPQKSNCFLLPPSLSPHTYTVVYVVWIIDLSGHLELK